MLPLLSGEWRPGPALGLGLAAWIAAATLTGLIGAARSQAGWAWPATHRFGMALAHFGLAVFVAGVTVVSAYQIHRELRLAPGESVTLGEYSFRFDDAVTAFGPNYVSTRATLDVMRDGRHVARLFPEKRRYNASGIVLTEAAIHAGLFDDLYVSLGERLDGRAWSLRIYVKPLVEWIFAGFALMAAGGFLAASGRRTRRARAAKSALAPDWARVAAQSGAEETQ